MTNKNTITKWLLTINAQGDVLIETKEISRYTPVNRVLDHTGYFNLMVETVHAKKYLLVYEKSEEHAQKSKLLVSRIHDFEERIIDMNEEDEEAVRQIANKHMAIQPGDGRIA